MSNLNSGNLLDAGASSATKHTDLADGIHEDISSDLAREHGPGGVKKPFPLHATGASGGMLDNVGGPASTLGSDAKIQSGASLAAGASSATKTTELTDGIHEDASKGIESVKGHGSNFSSGSSALDSLKKIAGGGK